MIPMALQKTVVTKLLMHWSYHSLVLSYRYKPKLVIFIYLLKLQYAWFDTLNIMPDALSVHVNKLRSGTVLTMSHFYQTRSAKSWIKKLKIILLSAFVPYSYEILHQAERIDSSTFHKTS